MNYLQKVRQKFSPSVFEERRIQQIQGVGSDTVLRTLGPILDKRMEELTIKLVQCEPQLHLLLDVRAQFAEVFRLQRELKAMKELGKEAGEVLAEMLQPSN